MKKILQAFLFNMGYVLAALVGWRDRTWMGDAKVFTYAFFMGASFKAPNGKVNYQLGLSLVPTTDMAYAMAEINADRGRRLWAMSATDEELVEAINRNQQSFSEVAEIEAYKEVVRWLDDEHRIIVGEMKHRVRFHRQRTSLEVQQEVSQLYGTI